jgi:hypothetical protein
MHGTFWGVAKNVEGLSPDKRPVVKGVVLVTSYLFLSVHTILPVDCHGSIKDAFISIFSGDTLAASPPYFWGTDFTPIFLDEFLLYLATKSVEDSIYNIL